MWTQAEVWLRLGDADIQTIGLKKIRWKRKKYPNKRRLSLVKIFSKEKASCNKLHDTLCVLCFVSLAGVAYGACLADYRNLHLTGIGHFVLNLLGDVGWENLDALVVNLVGTDDDAELTTGLDGIRICLDFISSLVERDFCADLHSRDAANSGLFARTERVKVLKITSNKPKSSY